MKTKLTADVKYPPYPMPKLWSGSAANFCYDEIKMNLLWLVCPEVDHLLAKSWQGNPVTLQIDFYLSKDLRKILAGPPIEFMRDFMIRGPEDLTLTEGWPAGYISTMWGRACEANTRLCAELAPNVYKFDFVNKRRFG